MVNACSVVAHLVKLLVTVVCTRHLVDPYSAKDRAWSQRAFHILLLHSILGVLRFGVPSLATSSPTAKYFRRFYDAFSGVLDVALLALLTTDILHAYQVHENIRLTLLTVNIALIFFQLVTKRKECQIRKHRLLVNITTTLQLVAIAFVGIRNGNYNVISLIASYAFQRFFVEEFSYQYDVPYTDLIQYCLSFVEIFATLTLKEL